MKIKNIKKYISTATFLAVLLFSATVFAGNEKNLWTTVKSENAQLRGRDINMGDRYRVVSLNRNLLDSILQNAPFENTEAAAQSETILEVPTPEGFERFRIIETQLLAPEIAAKYPNWKYFLGQGIDDPTAVAAFDVNELGFHGYVSGAKGTFLIDPYSQTDTKNYIVYYKTEIGSASRENFVCNFKSPKKDGFDFQLPELNTDFSNAGTLRTFRLAISVLKEYTAFFSNDQNSALAAVGTTVNRINVVYRRELSVSFTIVSDTRTIFTATNNGGFPEGTASNVAEASLDRNQIVLDQTYGSANYDIGHVLAVTPNPNGLAASPSLCDPQAKAQGFTGSQTPQGDGFDVDYVAHEIGHQFSMSHTFNNSADGSCTTRSNDSAYEPASGITIMGYGGICAPRNLAANSIEYFNLRSFDQALNYLQTTVPQQYPNCGSTNSTGNQAPTVTTQGNFNIPKQTPFTLTASATDPDNNSVLTYSWEEFDLGAATASNGAVDTDEDGNARPVFRSYNPTTSGSRTFPSLYYILNNANVPPLTFTGTLPFAPTGGSTNGYVCANGENCVTGERLPSIARTMTFRVTVRDNAVSGASGSAGGVADAQSVLTVAGNSGPFSVTTQNTAVNWSGGSTQNITWDAANTQVAPVNTNNVKISLSIDGGQTFPVIILESTNNDGSEQIVVPNIATNQARIKIEAVGNIFFDINNVNFTITRSAPSTEKRSDFDGDGRSDLSVFRPSEGKWYLNQSTSGFNVIKWGLNGDILTPGDFDGDNKTDTAIFRPSTVEGEPDFYVLNSSNFTFTARVWGTTGDISCVADYDGDNKDDFCVWRPSNGTWYVKTSSGNERYFQLGLNGDKVVPGDYDGDGKADFSVYRPSNGIWYIVKSANNEVSYTNWGLANDIPVFADYDGDKKDDIAVFRPSSGVWYIQKSSGGNSFVQFGLNGDIPVPGDYDGDGRYDVAVYRNGTWFVNNSLSGFAVSSFGLSSDIPTPKSYLPN